MESRHASSFIVDFYRAAEALPSAGVKGWQLKPPIAFLQARSIWPGDWSFGDARTCNINAAVIMIAERADDLITRLMAA